MVGKKNLFWMNDFFGDLFWFNEFIDGISIVLYLYRTKDLLTKKIYYFVLCHIRSF